MLSAARKSVNILRLARYPSKIIISNKKYSVETPQTLGKENDSAQFDEVLYDGHISTSGFQKLLLTVGSGAMSFFNPSRDDMIAVFGEVTGYSAAKRMRQCMLNHEEGREILRDKPRINSSTVDFDYLKSLPENSLGGVYYKFFQDNGVSPDTRQPVHFIDDKELAYVIQRYREVHDLVHAVLYMPTNMLGEVTVKWIEGIQTGLPMCLLGGLFGASRLSKKQRQLYTNSYLPWAIKCGNESEFLLNIYFEKHWEEPVEQLRSRLKIPDLIPK